MKLKTLDSSARTLWLNKETGLLWQPEFQFCETRNWRADHACPAIRTLIEVDGGIWTRGRHSRGKGIEGDNEKLNTAAALGWFVLRYSTNQFKAGNWIEEVAALKERFYGEHDKG